MINFQELREQLTDETIKDILGQFNVEPVEETESEIIFPTCDHNLEGGSPKLFYYKNTKLFRSYTDDEQKVFDIFSLLQKMMKLRGRDISLKQAIQMCDLSIDENITSLVEKDYSRSSADDIRYMQQLNNTYIPNVDEILSKKTGICLDYAAVMASMLRSQKIPTRLEVGYAGEAYHAWISTYVEDQGWINGIIQFDGENWSIMDPTFAANTSEKELKKFIGDGSKYLVKYIY